MAGRNSVAHEAGVDGMVRQQVVTPGDGFGALTVSLFPDVTNTQKTVQYPSGAKTLAVSYRLLPGATAVANQYAKIVLNAASDMDALGKLSTVGAFIPICQGDDLLLSAIEGDPITRVDLITAAAVGAEKTLLTLIAGVAT